MKNNCNLTYFLPNIGKCSLRHIIMYKHRYSFDYIDFNNILDNLMVYGTNVYNIMLN